VKTCVIKILTCLVILVFLGAPQKANAADSNPAGKQTQPSLAHLAKFVGKYPSSMITDPAFQQVAVKALGKARFKTVADDLTLEFPIERQGQLIFFRRSKPHDVDSLYAVIFINVSDNSVEACWIDEHGKNYWFSSKKQPRLLGNISADLKQENYPALYEKYGKK
jgi:hypothetical protein